MTAALKVLKPGLFASLQDRGRLGFQHFGVPVSGALDQDALYFANRLVGNDTDQLVLEFTGYGGQYRVEADSIRIALACSGTIQVSGEPDRSYPAFRSVVLRRGDIFSLQHALGAACMAIAGGFHGDKVMGSGSTYLRGGFGGFKGRFIAPDDLLEVDDAHQNPSWENQIILTPTEEEALNSAILRAVLGPQDDHFTKTAMRAFTTKDYQLTDQMDRMGLRLKGPKLTHSTLGANIVSDPTVLGSIQVPGDGLPIILSADRQTTGGYPKIATLITSDMWRLARFTPGAMIQFQLIDQEAGEEAMREHLQWRDDKAQSMRKIRMDNGIELDTLSNSNVISGVVFEN